MKKLIAALALVAVLASPAYAAQQTITQEGAFDSTVRKQINDNFTELYAGGSGEFAADVTIAGDLTIGNGTPDVTQDGEDAYVEGTLEVDGAVTLDDDLTVGGTSTFTDTIEITGGSWIDGNASATIIGMLQSQRNSATESLPTAVCGNTVTSNSADVVTLPEASTVIGCRLTFICGTADDLDVNPADGTDQISVVNSVAAGTGAAITPSAGDAIRCTDIGSSITIQAISSNLWVAVGVANGAWTDVN